MLKFDNSKILEIKIISYYLLLCDKKSTRVERNNNNSCDVN